MLRWEAPVDTDLPGYDALHSVERGCVPPLSLELTDIAPFAGTKPYRGYLVNPQYVKYLQVHKVLVGNSGADYLAQLAGELEKEYLPEYLDAAGWAHAESALADDRLSAMEKVERIEKAERTWGLALKANDALEETELGDLLQDDARSFRIALNLAYAPLMKSIAVGDVVPSVRRRVLADTLAISQLASIDCHLAWLQTSHEGVASLAGFIHECNALSSLLLLDDPRYIPLPSSSRADNGFFHRGQTHDITIINQHFGTIKKIIPVEVKARPSGNDRQRYKALIISKNDLVYTKGSSASSTLKAFGGLLDGTASDKEVHMVEVICDRIKTKLAAYQKLRLAASERHIDSPTKFYKDEKTEGRRRRLGVLAYNKT